MVIDVECYYYFFRDGVRAILVITLNLFFFNNHLNENMDTLANTQDADSDMECSDNECYDEYYYNINDDTDIEEVDPRKTDPEYFEFKCLFEEQVDRLLNESVETLSNILLISPSLAKVS